MKKYIFAIAIGAVLFGGFSLRASAFDFSGYTLGDVTGQENWDATGCTSPNVVTTTVGGYTKALDISGCAPTNAAAWQYTIPASGVVTSSIIFYVTNSGAAKWTFGQASDTDYWNLGPRYQDNNGTLRYLDGGFSWTDSSAINTPNVPWQLDVEIDATSSPETYKVCAFEVGQTPCTLGADKTFPGGDMTLNYAYFGDETGGGMNTYLLELKGVLFPSTPPPPVVPAATFIVPSTSYYGPDFSNWVINFYPNTTTTKTYYLQVQYYNGAFVSTSSVDTQNYVHRDYSSIVTNGTTTWTFPKTDPLFNYENSNEATSTWNAALYISTSSPSNFFSQTDFVSFIITPHATTTGLGTTTQYFSDGTTSSVALNNLAGPFFWNPAQVFTGPSTIPQTLASSSAELAAQCPPPADWTDIGGGLTYGFCSAINWLFVPPAASQQYINDSVAAMKSVPPFSYFFLLNATVSSTVPATSTFTGSSMIITDDIYGHTSSIELFPADVSQNSFLADTTYYGQSVANLWYNLILGAFIVVIVVSIYKLVA